MSYLWQEPTDHADGSEPSEEQTLKQALEKGYAQLLHLPASIEHDFRRHSRARAVNLLRQSVYWLITLYLLVVVPIFLFNSDPTMPTWISFGMVPIGVVLAGMWASTRLSALDAYIEITLSISLFLCLLGTLYCSIVLGGKYFGQMAAYETIYILVIAFSILQLPAKLAVGSALAAFAPALLVALLRGHRPYWLDVMLYFGVPLIICTVNGYILEYSERRNFVQNLLLNTESQRLAQLRAKAEHETRKQQEHAEFLALISGNLSLEELFSRTLKFLVDHTDARVAVAYHLNTEQRLQRISSWAGDADSLEGRKEVALDETLMGPALQTGKLMQLKNIRADYLPVRLGMATLQTVAIMVLPITQEGKALAVIELGSLQSFSAEDCAAAEAIRMHLAYAIIAANAREITQSRASHIPMPA